jgi:hypothetical protein
LLVIGCKKVLPTLKVITETEKFSKLHCRAAITDKNEYYIWLISTPFKFYRIKCQRLATIRAPHRMITSACPFAQIIQKNNRRGQAHRGMNTTIKSMSAHGTDIVSVWLGKATTNKTVSLKKETRGEKNKIRQI